MVCLNQEKPKMINLHFKLQPIKTKPFSKLLLSGRLLGDVFNGWFKRRLIDLDPDLYVAVRPPQSERALYICSARQCMLEPNVKGLEVRLTLLGIAAPRANETLAHLLNLEVIELGPPQCLLKPYQFTVSEPGRSQIHFFDAESGLYEELPEPWLKQKVQTQCPEFADSHAVTLSMFTPPRIGQLGSNELPSLVQIVKNLSKKLLLVEPSTALALGLESKDWYDQERELNSSTLVNQSITPTQWMYQSENQRMHSRQGWIGQLHYEGAISPTAMQLLWLGQWMGIGQNGSGGQGLYTLQ
jgi:hypothetical protein